MTRTFSVLMAAMLVAAMVSGCRGRGRGGPGTPPPPPADAGPGADSGGPGGCVPACTTGFTCMGTTCVPDGPGGCTPPCGPGETCMGTVCVPDGPGTETVCNDALDNDMDGMTDCADSDCAAAPGCAPGMCRSFPITEMPGMFCSPTTDTCIMGCTDGMCVETCLMNDADPNCWACAVNNIIACQVSTGSCQMEFDCLSTCGEDNCPMGSAPTCADTMCASELAAWRTCQTGASMDCGTRWTTCF